MGPLPRWFRSGWQAQLLQHVGGADSSRSMRGIVDPDYERVLERALGIGWRDDALHGTDAFFQTDQAAAQAWRFDKADAARVRQPAILFLGEFSTRVNPIREPVHKTLLSWLPNAEGHTLEGASHLLPLQEPVRISSLLTAFYKARSEAENHSDG